jgi:hypothetical protein
VTTPTIPRPLARQIDRLSRRAHAFHRYAHHPLCEPYRREVLRIGRRLFLCKGCTYVTTGLVLGVVAGAIIRPPPAWGFAVLASSMAAGVASLRLRVPKLVGRAWPGVGIGLGLWAGWPCALGSTLLVGLVGLLYRRRGTERARCDTCHERERQPCSGFARIVRRERAFQRKAHRWLAEQQADRASGNLAPAKKTD